MMLSGILPHSHKGVWISLFPSHYFLEFPSLSFIYSHVIIGLLFCFKKQIPKVDADVFLNNIFLQTIPILI